MIVGARLRVADKRMLLIEVRGVSTDRQVLCRYLQLSSSLSCAEFADNRYRYGPLSVGESPGVAQALALLIGLSLKLDERHFVLITFVPGARDMAALPTSGSNPVRSH